MALVDYSDSDNDEPVPPPPMHLACVLANEQSNSTSHAADRAAVPTLHSTLAGPASIGSVDTPPSQNDPRLRDTTNETTATPPDTAGAEADATSAEQVCCQSEWSLGGMDAAHMCGPPALSRARLPTVCARCAHARIRVGFRTMRGHHTTPGRALGWC